jgi:sulfofructosephosphate aldolase
MNEPRAGLAALARPSGAFAMVALDQRESLRTMLAAQAPDETVPDAALSTFKVQAARALSPHASAVLVDVAFGLRPVLDADVLAPGCGLIVAADSLDQPPGGVVEGTSVDRAVFDDPAIAQRADAYKLLVIWRAGRERDRRAGIVRAFLAACRDAGRPGIVEGIVRPEPGTRLVPRDHAALVLEAAVELGSLGPDLYKAEVPTLGLDDDDAIVTAARRVTEALPCPWVVLSNGVRPDRFDDAAIAACRGGASGFLAGRAIWVESISSDDPRAHLETVAAPRLAALAARVDGAARQWTAAASAAGPR